MQGRRLGMEDGGKLVGAREEGARCSSAKQAAKVLLHLFQENDTRRVAVEVTIAAIINVELAERVNHGYQLGIGGRWLRYGSVALHLAGGLYSRLLAVLEFGLNTGVHVGVGKVDIGHEFAQQRLGAV